MVIVPGRSDVDIGYNLLNAVPNKYQHLINNIELANHAEMMRVLTDKFGTSWLVIDDVVSQMEKLKLLQLTKDLLSMWRSLKGSREI